MKRTVLKISDFCETGSGGTPPRLEQGRYYGGGIPWVKSGELRENIIFETEESVTAEAIRETTVKIVPERALLVAMYGATIGRVAILGVPAATNQAICHIIPDNTVADVKYLFHFLVAQKNLFLMRGTGGAQPNISQGIIRETQIHLPPLLEQRRISTILDKADAIRRKRQQAIKLADDFLRATFLDMFGDPVTNPKGWRMSPLRECTALIQIGPFGSLLHQEDYISGGVPLVNPKHIQGARLAPNEQETVTLEKYAELSTYHLCEGDIVMGRRGEMGRCAIVGPEHNGLLCGTGSLFIRPGRLLKSAFLCSLFTNPSMKKRLDAFAQGATLPNLNAAIIGDLIIYLPPMALQHKFCRCVEQLESLKTTQHASLNDHVLLSASLFQSAFRGDL